MFQGRQGFLFHVEVKPPSTLCTVSKLLSCCPVSDRSFARRAYLLRQGKFAERSGRKLEHANPRGSKEHCSKEKAKIQRRVSFSSEIPRAMRQQQSVPLPAIE